MLLGWMVGLALASDGATCEERLVAPSAHPSVAWVSPVRKQVRAGARLWVVPTDELSAWLAEQEDGSVERMLQALGLRKSGKRSKRAYKVVVFSTDDETLCRPLFSSELEVAGAYVCDDGEGTMGPEHDGCGQAVDWATGESSFTLYRATWRDLVRQGFCLLPAERFVSEAR